jgi:hypothetical protein
LFSDAYSNALYDVGLSKKAYRFEKCGKPMTLFCTSCGHQEVIKYACGLRTCPVCSRKMSAYYVSKFWDVLRQLPINPTHQFRLITLTSPLDISFDNVRTVRSWSGKFCRRVTGKGEGSICGLEAGETGHLLHVHILHYGRFKKQQDLVELWSTLSGGVCKVVDVRAIKGQEKEFMLRKGLKEVLKYSTKITSMNAVELANLELALKGTRRISTYGIFYRLERWIRAERKTFVRVCPVCGGTSWLPWDGLTRLERGAG